jgi:hypothetical protein
MIDDTHCIHLRVSLRARDVYVVLEWYSIIDSLLYEEENVLKKPKLKHLLNQRSPTRKKLGLLRVVLLPSMLSSTMRIESVLTFIYNMVVF